MVEYSASYIEKNREALRELDNAVSERAKQANNSFFRLYEKSATRPVSPAPQSVLNPV